MRHAHPSRNPLCDGADIFDDADNLTSASPLLQSFSLPSLKGVQHLLAFDNRCEKRVQFGITLGPSSGYQVTPLEIETAKADIACRDAHGVTRTWFDAQAALQHTEISKCIAEFDAAAADVRATVDKARSV
ncbi:hypothetical protein R1T08_19790 [Streptomyces sp. SBC-4]|nr:hypothetical protein [Streptomyces sp. SBC-4]MDV5146379.1 hypothetical protein [Streptomyces sp. SBC-4]